MSKLSIQKTILSMIAVYSHTLSRRGGMIVEKYVAIYNNIQARYSHIDYNHTFKINTVTQLSFF